MARIWMDGFEHQQAHNYIVATGASLGWDTGRRGYGKSVKASYSHISVNSNGVVSLNLPTVEQRAEVFVRLAVYYASSLSTATVKFLNSLNETICSLTLPITANSDIVVKNRADQQIGTHFLANPAVWLLIQGHFIVDPSNGLVDLRINGVQVANFSGSTSSAAALYKTAQMNATNKNFALYMDDYAVNDSNGSVNNSWVLDGDILGAPVTGQGQYAEWMGSDGNQVNNYALINGVGTSLSDYVESNTVDQRELYTITPDAAVNLSQREIVAVQPLFIARKTNANDPAALRPMYRDNGVDYELESPQNLDTNWQYHRGVIMPLAPDLSPWTASKLTNLQVGVKKTS